MTLRAFTRLFYAFQFFSDFIFIYAVDKLLFLDRGVNLSQIAILMFLWSVMSMALEVPSGALADRWSRRKIIVLSGIFYSLCYLIWIFSHSFWGFLLGFFFRTLGGVFSSGTLQAYVYDFLKLNKVEKDFENIWGRGEALRLIGIAAAVGIGGFLSGHSYNLTLALSAIFILLTTLIALFWPEIAAAESTEEVHFWSFVKQALSEAFTNRVILKVLIYLALFVAVLGMLEEFDNVYLDFLGFDKAVIGLILMSSALFQGLGSLLAHKLKARAWPILYGAALSGGLAMLALWLLHSTGLFLALIFLMFLYGLTNVLCAGLLQREVASEKRATITSAAISIIDILPHSLVFGFLASRFGLPFGYGFFGMVALGYLLGAASWKVLNRF